MRTYKIVSWDAYMGGRPNTESREALLNRLAAEGWRLLFATKEHPSGNYGPTWEFWFEHIPEICFTAALPRACSPKKEGQWKKRS